MANENLKDKALKFVKLNPPNTKTRKVAEHLGISDDEAYDILYELRMDGLIKSGGQLPRENKDIIVWYI